ncbi:MAG: hypothetical protein ACRD3R_15160, partial [Terriglobales bacterium]
MVIRKAAISKAAVRKAPMKAMLLALGLASLATAATVQLERVPDGGIQPQALVDERGAVHLIYFKGEPGAGDVYYVRRAAGDR